MAPNRERMTTIGRTRDSMPTGRTIRDDIHLLGGLRGEVIRTQAGSAAFDREEHEAHFRAALEGDGRPIRVRREP